MIEEWSPILSDAKLLSKVGKKLAITGAQSTSDSSYLERLSKVTLEPSGKLVDAVGIASVPPVEWIIDGVIPFGGLIFLYGQEGRFKTTTTLDLCSAISWGQKWAGLQTRTGPVLYITNEGLSGLGQRMRAARLMRLVGDDVEAPMKGGITRSPFFLLETVPLHEDYGGEIMLRALKALSPIRPRLIVFDTLASHTPGLNEIDSVGVSTVLSNIRNIMDFVGCSVLIIHHTRKSGDAMRGHSSFAAAADTIISQSITDGGTVLMKVEKQRDGEGGKEIELYPTQVNVPSGYWGRGSSAVGLEFVNEEKVEEASLILERSTSDAMARLNLLKLGFVCAPDEGFRDRLKLRLECRKAR